MKSKAQQASVSPTVMRQFAQCNSHVHRLSICCFLSKTDVFIVHILCEFGIRETRYANYRVAVGLLVGQGWEQRRPTLPKLYVSKARPKVLVFLHLNPNRSLVTAHAVAGAMHHDHVPIHRLGIRKRLSQAAQEVKPEASSLSNPWSSLRSGVTRG